MHALESGRDMYPGWMEWCSLALMPGLEWVEGISQSRTYKFLRLCDPGKYQPSVHLPCSIRAVLTSSLAAQSNSVIPRPALTDKTSRSLPALGGN